MMGNMFSVLMEMVPFSIVSAIVCALGYQNLYDEGFQKMFQQL